MISENALPARLTAAFIKTIITFGTPTPAYTGRLFFLQVL
jgi:hypothetical protein